jgi:hypothetical protein
MFEAGRIASGVLIPAYLLVTVFAHAQGVSRFAGGAHALTQSSTATDACTITAFDGPAIERTTAPRFARARSAHIRRGRFIAAAAASTTRRTSSVARDEFFELP